MDFYDGQLVVVCREQDTAVYGCFFDHAAWRQEDEAMLPRLTPARRAAIEGCRSAKAKKESLMAGLLLRRALEDFTGQPFEAFRFARGPHGKPYAARSLSFNLTHTEGFAACMVSCAGEVGIDAERLRPAPRAVLRRAFTAAEQAYVLRGAGGPVAARMPCDGQAPQMPQPTRTEADDLNRRFFALWTRKEALVKCDGRGLTASLNTICALPAAYAPACDPHGATPHEAAPDPHGATPHEAAPDPQSAARLQTTTLTQGEHTYILSWCLNTQADTALKQ